MSAQILTELLSEKNVRKAKEKTGEFLDSNAVRMFLKQLIAESLPSPCPLPDADDDEVLSARLSRLAENSTVIDEQFSDGPTVSPDGPYTNWTKEHCRILVIGLVKGILKKQSVLSNHFVVLEDIITEQTKKVWERVQEMEVFVKPKPSNLKRIIKVVYKQLCRAMFGTWAVEVSLLSEWNDLSIITKSIVAQLATPRKRSCFKTLQTFLAKPFRAMAGTEKTRSQDLLIGQLCRILVQRFPGTVSADFLTELLSVKNVKKAYKKRGESLEINSVSIFLEMLILETLPSPSTVQLCDGALIAPRLHQCRPLKTWMRS
ncbi:uncharacterized protein V6R79_022725 [Siganus canaliculatus]